MPKYLPKNRKLLVISDTGMFLNKDGSYSAFSPVVKELEYLLQEFDEISWIGFKNEINNNSFVKVNNNRIKVILLKQVGGKKIKDKLKVILNYPIMSFIILKNILKHKYIHSRAPSNPSILVVFFSYIFKNKIFWHKYAGSWVDDAPVFYKAQRFLLNNLTNNSIVTINGNYSSKDNILPFENPCLDKDDRDFGKDVIKNKKIKGKINFCFVGALTNNKGVEDIIQSFKKISNHKIGCIHFVGDSSQKQNYIKLTEELMYDVVFHGFLPKDEIRKVYIKSHFILLPSKSEGFPKVIGEAMNYGCIPIVSNISCISEYVIDNMNGYLIEKPYLVNTLKNINKALEINNVEFLRIINHNFKVSKKFTYKYYNYRVINDIFKFNI